MIEVQQMTLTYPSGKGVFDLTFEVSKGEIVGCLGPNGAGKTTTIRALMGFMKPNAGSCSIQGLDCWADASLIQKFLGYIPGEISFLDSMRGDEYLDFIQKMRGKQNSSRQKELLTLMDLDPRGKISKFSKGMKQKLAIVSAFMHDPAVLILDEPTSGLDPLVQNHFMELLIHERSRGKTIFLSSHRFDEVERACDNVLIIREGQIIRQADVKTLKQAQVKRYLIRSEEKSAIDLALKEAKFELTYWPDDRLEVLATGQQTDQLIKILSRFSVLDLDVKQQTLEEIFMQYYRLEDV